MRIVLLGPQGAGKGTQAELLSQRMKARHVATGNIIRQEIRTGSELGRVLRAYNDRGELVPDELMLQLIRPVLWEVRDWILDGFPRDTVQARALDDVLRQEGWPLDRAVALEMPDDAVAERLAGRRQSESTGAVYHLIHNPPPASDPGPFVVRADDAPEGIRRRLALYHEATEPLKTYYDEQGLLARVDAQGEIDQVRDRVFAALGLQ